MHEPNVLEFPAPESHIGFAKHSFDDPKLDSAFERLIDEHPFNSKVSIFLPGDTSHRQRVEKSIVEDREFYEVENLPLYEFCKPEFLQAFLNAGKVYGVSCDSRLDLDNAAALTPDGWLVLLLDKFTYSELRLNGKLSAHILRRPKERFIVKVNLKDNFTPGKPYYKKVVNAFKEVGLKFTFWITWLPNDADVCPSSIAKYFSDKGYDISQQNSHMNKSNFPKADVPLLDVTTSQGLEEGSAIEPEALLEWIGCTTLGIRLNPEGSAVCDVINPVPSRTMDSVQTIQSTGFFVPSHIRLLMIELRSQLEETCEETLPWISLTVYGHVDSPVTWSLTENLYYANGDNFYTIILMRTRVWLYKVSGSRKPLRAFAKCNNNK